MKYALLPLGICLVVPAILVAQTSGTFKANPGIHQQFKILVDAKFPEDCPGGNKPLLPGAVLFPQDETRTIGGVSFVIKTQRMKYNNQICLTTDFSDLHAKLPAIVASANVPKNNCVDYIGFSPVVDFGSPNMVPYGNHSELMLFSVPGKKTTWVCRPGAPVPHSEWATYGKLNIPYLRVWTTPGPDVKTIAVPAKNFTEYGVYKLVPSATNVVVQMTGEDVPRFTEHRIPEANLTVPIGNALQLAIPAFPSIQGPLVQVEGARYHNGKSQIWGRY